jgi:hypothetical protein
MCPYADRIRGVEVFIATVSSDMSGILQVRNAVPEERYSGTERAPQVSSSSML